MDTEALNIRVARSLLAQADKEDSLSSFWLVSVAHNLATNSPDMTMKTFFQIVCEEMPKQVKQHADYLRNT